MRRGLHLSRSRKPDAAEVIPGLRIGSCPNRDQARQLFKAGVTRAVDLRAEVDATSEWPDGVTVLHLPLIDHGSPTVEELRKVAEAVLGLVRDGEEVFIHCHAGQERAPTVACAVLILQGWSLGDAYRRVSDCRPITAPTEGQALALREMAAGT